MAAVTLGATYSPPSPLEFHYPDTISSIHPDRPIRPLPKRRLRSKISPNVADSILYPPETTSSLAHFQTPSREPSKHMTEAPRETPNGRINSEGDNTNDSYTFTGNDFGSDDEAVTLRQQQELRQRPVSITSMSSKIGFARSDGSGFVKPPIPQSAASSNDSVDGYDSFENTNNKKKRKIPMSGSLGSHQSSLSTEMAQMGLSSNQDIDASHREADSGVGHYYGSGSSAIPTVSSGSGISGAGRGRYGRPGTRHFNGRSPLSVSVNGSNALQANRSLYLRRDNAMVSGLGSKDNVSSQTPDQGIISAAMANAAALPVTPARGQENIGLFEQQSSRKPTSAKTQFTFTCESDSAKSMMWPDVQSPLSRWDRDAVYASKGQNVPTSKGPSTQSRQVNSGTAGQAGRPVPQEAGVHGQGSQQPRKPRRSLEKQYKIAARDRRLRQEYSNYHHPPKDEDIWICQFCEYESIFGEKPSHLIRQYEAKDRRERKRLAEKRRLLEKAKMKARKGKKGNKNSKNSASATQQQQKQQLENQPLEEAPMQQSEEYGLDDYDEDPASVPMRQQTPSKIPQPITQSPSHSLRPPSGSGMLRQNTVPG